MFETNAEHTATITYTPDYSDIIESLEGRVHELEEFQEGNDIRLMILETDGWVGEEAQEDVEEDDEDLELDESSGVSIVDLEFLLGERMAELDAHEDWTRELSNAELRFEVETLVARIYEA